MMHDGYGTFFGGGIMWVFWIVLIIVLVMVIKGLLPDSRKSEPQESPLDILKKRYAQGEINEEEYERRRRELEK